MQKLSRRHVLATLTSSTVMLCPALLNAQGTIDMDWADVPTAAPIGQDKLMELPAGPVEVDISDLAPGEVAVIARPNSADTYSATGSVQYIGVHRRTDDQIAFGAANDREGTVKDPRFFVADLVCPHRGKAIGFTGDPAVPFACTDRGRRHGSNFDASGLGVGGASDGDPMVIPAYEIIDSGGIIVLSLG